MRRRGAFNIESNNNYANTNNLPRFKIPFVLIAVIIFFTIFILIGILIAINFISFEGGKLSLGNFKGLILESAYIEGENVNVVVGRGDTEENLTGIRFIFYYNETDNITIERAADLKKNEKRTFIFNSTEIPGIVNYRGVSIAPVFASDSGEETVGEIEDTEEISSTPPSSGGGGGGGSSGDGSSNAAPSDSASPLDSETTGTTNETTNETNVTGVNETNVTTNETNETAPEEPPTGSSIVLSSSSGSNLDSDDLVATPQTSASYDTLIYDWREGGNSIAVLNLPFDTEISTTTSGAIQDYSTHNNDGTLGGGSSSSTPTWISNGINGGAYDFEGSESDRITIDNFVPPTAGTIAFWMRIESQYYRHRILGSHDAYEIVLENGRLWNNLFAGGSYYLTSNAVLNTGAWYFLAFTYDYSSHIQEIYINGVLDSSGTRADDMPYGSTLTIGTRTGTPDYFDGVLDEIRIYDRVLSSEQIAAMYNNGVPSYDKIVSQETFSGDSWSVTITSNNGINDVETLSSNSLIIS